MASEEKVTQDPSPSGENGKPKAQPTATPIEMTHPESVDPKAIRLFREPSWKLRMTIEGDRSYLKIKVVRAAPLSQPSRYVCFLDGKDEVVCMVDDLNDLEAGSRPIVQEELDRRYLTSTIDLIESVRSEFGVSYWDVQTDRGRREFVVQDVSENAQWLGERRLLLIDVDGNRFEIPDIHALDRRSAKFLESVI